MNFANHQPRVSVNTVVRNGNDAITGTIMPVRAQDYPNIEYLIIDGTKETAYRYTGGVGIFLSELDSGIYAAKNKATHLASSEFVLFMNCGDAFANAHTLSEAMEHSPSQELILFGNWSGREKNEQLMAIQDYLRLL